MVITLEAGDAAPDFELPDQDGTMRSLGDYTGQNIVLYFYPKDFTPGWTTEACALRDEYAKIQAAGATIVGVSPDTSEKHKAFREEYDLPFDLLADTEHIAAEAYGAWGERSMYGKTFMGIFRSTFLIGPDANLLKVWKKVTPDEAGTDILSALEAG